jgi:putative oxidoreductase
MAIVFLRVFFAAILIYGTQDNVFSNAQMMEFRDFLDRQGFPLPLASAYLTVYAQFVCGILIAMGALTRPAGLLMVINFVVALVMVHVGLPFSANIAPMSMLGLAIFFAIHGSGRPSVDAWIRQRQGAGVEPSAAFR